MKRAAALLVMLSIMASAKSIVATFDAPSGDIAGLGWESGSLWAVDAMLKKVYEIDPSSGDVISSFQAAVATGFEATTMGLLAVVLVSAFYGLAMVYARKNMRGMEPLVAPTGQMILATLFLIPFALLIDRPFSLPTVVLGYAQEFHHKAPASSGSSVYTAGRVTESGSVSPRSESSVLSTATTTYTVDSLV